MTDLAKPSANAAAGPPGDDVVERDESSLPVDKLVFGVAATMILLFVGLWGPAAGGVLEPDVHGAGVADQQLRLALRADEHVVRPLRRLPGRDPLRQHQAGAGRLASRSSPRSRGCR